MRLLPGAERMPKMKLFRVSGYCRHHDYSAYLFAQRRMRRTSQLVGLDFSTGRSISPLPVIASLANARLIFMTFRERVRGAPLASLGNWRSIENKQQ
jgi:hypothetical protein